LKAVLLVLVTLLALSWAQDPAFKQFQDFIAKYKKSYNSVDEFNQRFQNFKASLDRVQLKNTKSDNGAVFGVTKFSDMTPEEFRSSMLMNKPIDPKEKKSWR